MARNLDPQIPPTEPNKSHFVFSSLMSELPTEISLLNIELPSKDFIALNSKPH